MKAAGNRVVRFGILLFLVLVAAVFHNQLLWAMGAWLVNAEPPRQTGMIVVIGGDYLGDRILKGAELVRGGYAPQLLASGSGTMYGQHEADLAITFAIQRGYPAAQLTAFRYPALSTVDEAQAVIRELRRLGIHKYTVVTTACHTARAGRIFRREAPDLEANIVEAPNRYWDHGYWWKSREGRKLWFFEASKVLADYFRM